MQIKPSILLCILSAATLLSCHDEKVELLPEVYVREEVFLNTTEAQGLNVYPNYIAISGGIRGILVVKQPDGTFSSLERACPYQPSNACGKINFHSSGTFLIDSCCGSRFDRYGAILNGPTQLPMKPYQTAFIPPNKLFITNQ